MRRGRCVPLLLYEGRESRMSTTQETIRPAGAATEALPAWSSVRVRAWLRQPDIRAALAATLALRLFTSGFMAFIVYALHSTFVSVTVQANTQGQALGLTIAPTSLHGIAQYLTTPWVRWDADVYLKIAERGYAWYGSTAFLPLYPGLIRLGGLALGGHYILASLLISTVASFFVFLYLYRLALRCTGSPLISRLTLVVACLLPVAFFLMAPYTESLFLALALATVLATLDGEWTKAACFAVIASLTRQQGVLLSLLAAPALLSAGRAGWRNGGPWRDRFAQIWQTGRAPALFVVAAVGSYAVWILVLTQALAEPAPWQVLTSSHGWRQHFVLPGSGVLNDLSMIVRHPGLTFAHKLSLPLDVCAAALGAIGLWLARRRLPAGLILFLVGCWCVALIKVEPTGVTNSAARYLLTLLPVCIVPATWLSRARPPLRVAYFGLFLIVACVYMTEWVLWSWVS